MSSSQITALIADDEPLLREALVRMLHQCWPALQVVAQARNGREAIELFDAHRPAICFLDVQMPGITGIEAAQHIGRQAHLVFVTAYDQYAVQAFSHGVLDYLVKPVEPVRLAETVARLQERVHAAPAINTDEILMKLASAMRSTAKEGSSLRWIRASVANTVRLIPIEDVDFLRADEKYTVVGWRDETGKPLEAIIRTPLKELIPQLDAEFAQIHRAAVVNLRAISHVTRNPNETAEVYLKNRPDVLPVSRSYLHLFRQM